MVPCATVIEGSTDAGNMSRKDALARIANAVAVINQNELRIDRELLSHAPKLRLVASATAGFDNMDREARGQDDYDLHEPLVVGDDSTVATAITDARLEQGRTGRLGQVLSERRFTNQDSQLCAVLRATLFRALSAPPRRGRSTTTWIGCGFAQGRRSIGCVGVHEIDRIGRSPERREIHVLVGRPPRLHRAEIIDALRRAVGEDADADDLGPPLEIGPRAGDDLLLGALGAGAEADDQDAGGAPGVRFPG